MKTPWEISLFDWSVKGSCGRPLEPHEVFELIFTHDKDKAVKAYSLVCQEVGQNGWLYPCALPVLKTILACLPICSAVSKIHCLDLIALIVASESAPGAEDVEKHCMVEVRNAFWLFAHGVQFDDEKLIGSYVDILGCLGMKISELKGISLAYLEMALTRAVPEYDVEMVENTIEELKQSKAL
ncbi:hypothetical protein [Chitinimonas koreensis]|uniref:hypothetical protein n=1 Tax=Chitinimonas koreensis TaxID=356302 RepID=UPI0012FAE47D|nr:hypothetical protein [Chitinimonas koreensis]QNM98402.1 hypothetical protein H9L41_09295 [Chitinimonas koreensis]